MLSNLLKLVAIGLIGLVLFVPLTMILGLVVERSRYRDEARRDVAAAWTGRQSVIGPVLTLRCAEDGPRLVLRPATLTVRGSLDTEQRRRGLYAVPVYRSSLAIDGAFDLSGLDVEEAVATLGCTAPDGTVSIGIDDVRGVVDAPVLSWEAREEPFVAGVDLSALQTGLRAEIGAVDLPSAARMPFATNLALRGMESLQFAPLARDMRVVLDSAWPHPKFVGGHLPVEHEIDADGFTADWRVTRLARSVDVDDPTRAFHKPALAKDAFGIELIEPVDVYQQSLRSVKYGYVFIVLTFVAFYLTELLRGLNLHPIQYLLVGTALAIFFLLLLSLSEHLPFEIAYGASAASCVGLIAIYMAAAFRHAIGGAIVGVVLSGVYGMLYVILQAEDYALLMGSLLLFAALAAAMLLTRNLDWYKAVPASVSRPSE